jgi:hypothetical protein
VGLGAGTKPLVGSGGFRPLKLTFFKNDDVFGAENLITSMYFSKLIFV